MARPGRSIPSRVIIGEAVMSGVSPPPPGCLPYNSATEYESPLPYDGCVAPAGGVRFAKNYGSDNYPEQPFRWSKAWEDEFARRRRERELGELRARAEDFDRAALDAWREQEDEDLQLATMLYLVG